MDDVVNDGLRIRLRDGRDIADLLALFNEERFLRYASARGPFSSAAELRRGFPPSVAPSVTRRWRFWPAGPSVSPAST